MKTAELQGRPVVRRAGDIAFRIHGPEDGVPVVMGHSILTSGAMWEAQAHLLAQQRFRVICLDIRGHGASDTTPAPYGMDGLAADVVAVLDELRIDRAHYVGLSLGGMVGVGLGIHHADRVLSLCLCDMRADTPPAASAPWDERMGVARAADSCAPLTESTLERWFGRPFLDANPGVVARLSDIIGGTSVEGFSGCAQAIQRMDYLPQVSRITVPVTLIVGERDSVLPDAMRALKEQIPGAEFVEIEAAGHLPNIERPAAFDAALLRHFQRVAR
jgi:3-oxoadipate enol-lactonase